MNNSFKYPLVPFFQVGESTSRHNTNRSNLDMDSTNAELNYTGKGDICNTKDASSSSSHTCSRYIVRFVHHLFRTVNSRDWKYLNDDFFVHVQITRATGCFLYLGEERVFLRSCSNKMNSLYTRMLVSVRNSLSSVLSPMLFWTRLKWELSYRISILRLHVNKSYSQQTFERINLNVHYFSWIARCNVKIWMNPKTRRITQQVSKALKTFRTLGLEEVGYSQSPKNHQVFVYYLDDTVVDQA